MTRTEGSHSLSRGKNRLALFLFTWPVSHPLGPILRCFSRSVVLIWGRSPLVPEVLVPGNSHGKTSKVGTLELGEYLLVSVVVYLVILAVNKSMSIMAEEGGPTLGPGVK